MTFSSNRKETGNGTVQSFKSRMTFCLPSSTKGDHFPCSYPCNYNEWGLRLSSLKKDAKSP